MRSHLLRHTVESPAELSQFVATGRVQPNSIVPRLNLLYSLCELHQWSKHHSVDAQRRNDEERNEQHRRDCRDLQDPRRAEHLV